MDTMWIILLVALAILGAPLFAIFGAAAMLLLLALFLIVEAVRSLRSPPEPGSAR